MNGNYKHRHHHLSFRSALSGLFLAATSEINMKIIIVCSILAMMAGFVLNISHEEWLVLMIVIAMVYVVEMVNTSIEAVTDLITTEWREDAKIAKDVAAGAVLLVSIFALIIGILIFIPALFNQLG